MRQAVNYAIDRQALAQLGDAFSPLPAQPTDHYLPPGMPGFRDAHVYPMTPDVVKARSWRSGGGRTAVLYTCDFSPCPEQAQIVKTDLAAIGLQVQIKTFPVRQDFAAEAHPANRSISPGTAGFPTTSTPTAMLNRDPRRTAPTARPSTIRPTGAGSLPRRGSPAPNATSPTAGSTSSSPATPRPWPPSTTSPNTISSRRGSAARPTGSTAWTSPHSASNANTDHGHDTTGRRTPRLAPAPDLDTHTAGSGCREFSSGSTAGQSGSPWLGSPAATEQDAEGVARTARTPAVRRLSSRHAASHRRTGDAPELHTIPATMPRRRLPRV